jgi:pimeloyl-ACP methyl ester carboxylesterase
MSLLQPKSEFLSVRGLQLHYLDWGNHGAPPVVCVHGYTSSAQAFNAPARHLRERFHVIAPDVRGHGESAWSPDGAYQYRDQAADLAAIADQLGLERFSLIGTSMGGIIAMTYAEAQPERLAHLIINDIGPDAETGSQRITQMVGSRPDEFATLEDAMAYRRQMSPIVAGRAFEDQEELARGVLRRRDDDRWVWKMDPRYIQQRVAQGPPVRPPCGPCFRRCRVRPWSSGERTATCFPRRRPGGWPRHCRRVSWSRCPASAMRPRWWSPSFSPRSAASWLPRDSPASAPKSLRPQHVVAASISRFHR